MNEPLRNAIMFAISNIPGVRIFRNNVGQVKTDDGRFIKFGLCKGSSDLIGWKTENGVARFIAIEIKCGHTRTTPEQLNFIEQVKKAGGIAGIVHSAKEAEELLK